LSTSDDLGNLSTFLNDLKSILEHFMEEYIDEGIGKDFNKETFKKSFPAARRSIALCINRLDEPDEELLRKLDDHGLRGQSLTLKIEIVNVRHKLLIDEIKKTKTGSTKTPIWSGLKNFFSDYLKAADIPLESLADCIPGLGLALEFKKAVEHVSK
jgi:hypothetical protein